MKTFRSSNVRRVLVPVMAASVLSACHQWKVQEMAPAQVVAEKGPRQVRLTMLDGAKIGLFYPTVSDGEIVARPFEHWCREYVECGALRVPTDSVANIEIREADTLATVIVVTLGLAGALLVAFVIAVGTTFQTRY